MLESNKTYKRTQHKKHTYPIQCKLSIDNVDDYNVY